MRLIQRLFGRTKKNPPAARPPQAGAAPAPGPQAWLRDLLDRHGLESTVRDQWVLPDDRLPAIRGSWHPGERHGRLGVQVLVRDGVLVDERFAGIGAGDAGLADALSNFTLNSFHVLLSALWDRHDPGQVETAAWTIAGRRFDAFIGGIGTRTSAGVTAPIPADMTSLLAAAIRGEPLERDLHWFRFYVGQVKGEFTFEALKDNEHWPAGVDALASCGWTPVDAFYSARLFMVLREAAEEAPPPQAAR